MDFEYLSTEKKNSLATKFHFLCVLLQPWDPEKFWRVASVSTSCLWWRHISFTRNGLCSVKRKRSRNDVIWGFIPHLLGGTEENHQGFWGWLLLLQVFEPGTSLVRSRSGLNSTMTLIVFHSDSLWPNCWGLGYCVIIIMITTTALCWRLFVKAFIN